MPRRTKTTYRGWKKRAFSLLLAVSLTLGMVPGLTLTSAAEHWADSYLDQLVDWGVMRADQTSNPDAPLTRAEFMAVINRAYGYTKTGPIPFTDVSIDDWFYDDVSIAYTAGYTLGTSATTFHPNQTLNREQAVCILARNMMMEETPGENLAFSDARNVSSWARGLIKTAVDNYIVNGYPDGSFGPQDTVSKGQMASLIVQCIGTPLNKQGDYALGDVFGNVTITSSGVTLRDTTVSGDLYVSGGVGLGNVKLENVNVLGRVIVSGTGESQEGDASVVLRNVTANEMLVDNMKDQLVTLRADGLTNIGQTTVRTPAYLEDNTPDEFGLRKIDMQEAGAKLTLAGRVKEVVNTAPQSTIQVAKGTVAKLTIDEDAIGSTVQLDRNTEVKELNLDTGTNVTGQGDVDKMNVNASDVTSTMLPDNIYIRPGLEANIAGEVMDSAAAEESSLDPRILSGYPKASDVAPTSLKAEFAGNKRGTIYWGVSSITDGSITAEDLISPPSYGSVALKNGSVATPSADTVVPVSITGLTVGGSYYLSAVLVDARGERSPVKVISFTTPDNTKPAFAQGYPYLSLVTDTLAQATVMATKSCKLYYAVLPQGAQAPTVNDLKSAAVTGNLGYGVMDVVKNTEHTFTISRQLEELKNYVAYFWLTDADGANSSNIVSLRFTTKDMTPPEFDPDPDPNTATSAATSVTLTAGLNEAGTIYWAVVPEGKPYPLPNNQSSPLDKDNIMDGTTAVSAKLESEYAKSQVKAGRSATKRGQVAVRNADTDVTINITGLARESGYDLYYVAQDTAGNFSATVKKITIKTLDTTGPTVYQYFSDYQGEDRTANPRANSDLILQFSESINAGNSRDLLTLYEVSKGRQTVDGLTAETAHDELTAAIRNNFKLYQGEVGDPELVLEGGATIPWIKYDNVVVRAATDGSGKVEVIFPGKDDTAKGWKQAVGLSSGDRYYFELTAIRDNAIDPNATTPPTLNYHEIEKVAGSQHVLPSFYTVFAVVGLAVGDNTSTPPVWKGAVSSGQELDKDGNPTGNARVDATFIMTPQSTQNAADNIRYDIVVMADDGVAYDLYYRIIDKSTKQPIKGTDYTSFGYKLPTGTADVDNNGWVYLGNRADTIGDRNWESGAVCYNMLNVGQSGLPELKELSEEHTYEFAISVTEKNSLPDYLDWSGDFHFRVYVVASSSSGLMTLLRSERAQPEDIDAWNTEVTSTTGKSIGACGINDYVVIPAGFTDTRVPYFQNGPIFEPGDTFADVKVTLNREATIYYAVFPKDSPPVTHLTLNNTVEDVPTPAAGGYLASNTTPDDFWKVITAQTGLPSDKRAYLDSDGKLQYYTVRDNYPPAGNFTDGDRYYRTYPHGKFTYETWGVEDTITINKEFSQYNLVPETDYYIYMVVEGTSVSLSQVYIFNFHTTATARPKIRLMDRGPGAVGISTTNDPAISANIDYAYFTTSDLMSNSIFGKLFFKDNGDGLLSEGTAPTGIDVGKYTVLDALMATDTDGSSVFDNYAKSTVKDEVALIIRTSSYGTPVRSSTNVINNAENIVDHSNNMNKGEYYYVLAVGHHSAGTTDGFKAIFNIQVPDSEPPRIVNISTTKVIVKADTFRVPETDVTITFDKPVYWIAYNSPNTTRFPVVSSEDNNPITGTPTDRDNHYYGVLNVLGGSAAQYLTIPSRYESTEPTLSYTFHMKGATVGDTIIFFFGNGRVANEGGNSDGQVLTLNLKTRLETVGVTQAMVAYFECEYKDSNGDTVTIFG